MRLIDTRDLASRRKELKEQVVQEFNEMFEMDFFFFKSVIEELEHFADWEVKKFSDHVADELKEIQEIDSVEDEVGDLYEGYTLILYDDFEEYVQELVIELGYIPSDKPWWIEIDWSETAENLKMDYSEVEYEGETYLFNN